MIDPAADRRHVLPAPWPCPSCGGPLLWGSAWTPEHGTFVAVVCRAEDRAFEFRGLEAAATVEEPA